MLYQKQKYDLTLSKIISLWTEDLQLYTHNSPNNLHF